MHKAKIEVFRGNELQSEYIIGGKRNFHIVLEPGKYKIKLLDENKLVTEKQVNIADKLLTIEL